MSIQEKWLKAKSENLSREILESLEKIKALRALCNEFLEAAESILNSRQEKKPGRPPDPRMS